MSFPSASSHLAFTLICFHFCLCCWLQVFLKEVVDKHVEVKLLATAMTASDIRNISAWRLNKAELKELAERTEKGEDPATVKKELQGRRPFCAENVKLAALAISAKPRSTGPSQKASTKRTSPASESATAAATRNTDRTNAGYYALVD